MVRQSSRQPKPTAKYSAYKQSLVKTTKTSGVVAKPVLRKAIQRVVNSNVETKYVSFYPYSNSQGTLNGTNFTPAITTAGECYALIPPIRVGPGDHQRIGQTIQPTSLTVKGFVSLFGNQADSFDILVDIFFLTSKTLKDQQQQGILDMNQLLNNGDGTNAQYDGSYVHGNYPLNTTAFSLIKRKTIRLTKPFGNMNTALCGGDPVNTANYSSEKYSKTFSVKIPLPKNLKYLTDADTTPTNAFPFVCLGWRNASNCDASGITNQLIKSTMMTHLYYKDS